MREWNLEKKPNHFFNDYYVYALMKYLTAVNLYMSKKGQDDVRVFPTRMTIENIHLRLQQTSEISNFRR